MYTEELLVLIWPMYFAVYPGSADITTSDPQFLCSSATIANPLELAEKICGRSFINIARSGAGISERIYCLVQPEEKLNKDGIPYGKRICYKCCANGPSSSADGTKGELFWHLPDPEKMWRSW